MSRLRDPSQPKSAELSDLLAWSMSLQEEGAQVDAEKHLTPERQAFLEAALASMTQDVVGSMKSTLELAIRGDSESQRCEALETLTDLVEDHDLANCLHQIGGFEPILHVMTSDHSSTDIVWRAADVLGTAVQNNPAAQEIAVDLKVVEAAVKLLDHSDEQVQAKALRMSSCLVRGHRALLADFIQYGGITKALQLLDAENSQTVIVKSLLVLGHCLQADFAGSSAALDLALTVDKVQSVLQHKANNAIWEHSTKVIRSLVIASTAFRELYVANQTLQGLVDERVKHVQSLSAEDLDAVREESSYESDISKFVALHQANR